MPEDRKTNINNLIIVWQGQSWSIIAPDGRVLERFMNKRQAFEYARRSSKYVLPNLPANDYLDEDFSEFADELYDKPKRGELNKHESKDTCFEIIIWLFVFLALMAPVPTLVILGIASLFFGFRLPFAESGEFFTTIFQNNYTLVILAILTVLVPRSLILVFNRQGQWSGKFLRQPLTLLFGLGGVLGILIGLFFTFVSLFNGELTTWRVLAATVLWGMMNYFAYRVAYELHD